VDLAKQGQIYGADPITEAIRREVIERQRAALQGYLNRQYPSEEISKLSSDKFKDFLGRSENKDRIAVVINKPEVQQQLQTIEKAGYAAVIGDPRNNFQPIAWDSEPRPEVRQAARGDEQVGRASEQRVPSADGQTVRSQVIRNGDQELCTLTERTTKLLKPIEVPVTIDGWQQNLTVASYRTVEFKTQLESNSGPVHVSLAVKDEQGRNIAKKDAVYFTAHYDEAGKLVEVSSPMPVKFMGEGKDAIGYIERNGYVYTLPVTQGTYKSMMQAVGRGAEVENLTQVTSPSQAEDVVRAAGMSGSAVRRDRAEEVRLPDSDPELVSPPSYNTATRDQPAVAVSKMSPITKAVSASSPNGVIVADKVPTLASQKACLDIGDFKSETAEVAGGLTGSKRIKGTDGRLYQLKDTLQDLTLGKRLSGAISTKQLNRGLKAANGDQENFAEVITSRVSKALIGTTESLGAELIPEVSLVYDGAKKRCLVASRYLESVVGDLDGYAKKEGKVNIKKRIKNGEEVEAHTKVVFTKKATVLEPDEFSIAHDSGLGDRHPKNEKNKLLRQDLARAIAVSVLSGDHDVNPGNMVVVKDKDGRERIARIDFGHAGNDLIHARILEGSFGGGVKDPSNRVLDFLNRETIASVGGKEDKMPKLWRDYEGVVPSRELAEAFKELSKSPQENLAVGIDSARRSFEALVEKAKGDPEALAHISKSLSTINDHIGGKAIMGTKPEEVIKQVFKNMGEFYKTGQSQMRDAARVMELQCDIDDLIKKSKEDRISSYDTDLYARIDQEYRALEKQEGIGLGKDKGIKWIKTGKDNLAFKGTLADYMEERTRQLKPELEQSAEVKALVGLQSDIDSMIRSHKNDGYPDPVLLEKVQNQYKELEEKQGRQRQGLNWVKAGEYSPSKEEPYNLAGYIAERGKALGKQGEGFDLSEKIADPGALEKAKSYQVLTDKVYKLQVIVEQLISNNKAEPKIFNEKLLSQIKAQYEGLGGDKLEWRKIDSSSPAIERSNLAEYIASRGGEEGLSKQDTTEIAEKIKLAPTPLSDKVYNVTERIRSGLTSIRTLIPSPTRARSSTVSEQSTSKRGFP
jgi:hypothetical protein